MSLFERISSLVTFVSLFILGPAFGRALVLWWDKRKERSLASQHIALAISTMIALTILLVIYGFAWNVNHRAVVWYAWMGSGLPTNTDVSGSIEVSGNTNVSGSVDVSGSTIEISRWGRACVLDASANIVHPFFLFGCRRISARVFVRALPQDKNALRAAWWGLRGLHAQGLQHFWSAKWSRPSLESEQEGKNMITFTDQQLALLTQVAGNLPLEKRAT
jgi:hypothetical protein